MEMSEDDADELVEFWTLLDEDRGLLVGKRGAVALGFALLLKFYSGHGRFPRGRADLSDTVVDFVALQVDVPSTDVALYEWAGRTVEYHRAEIREYLGFRVATVVDQERLTSWLAVSVAHAERRADRVREELLAQFRRERIEAPTSGRVLRMVRSALRTAEQTWTARIIAQLAPPAMDRLLALVRVPSAEGDDAAEDDEGVPATVLGLIKSEPGNVSLESMMTEIGKLEAVRAVGLPPEASSRRGPTTTRCSSRLSPSIDSTTGNRTLLADQVEMGALPSLLSSWSPVESFPVAKCRFIRGAGDDTEAADRQPLPRGHGRCRRVSVLVPSMDELAGVRARHPAATLPIRPRLRGSP